MSRESDIETVREYARETVRGVPLEGLYRRDYWGEPITDDDVYTIAEMIYIRDPREWPPAMRRLPIHLSGRVYVDGIVEELFTRTERTNR